MNPALNALRALLAHNRTGIVTAAGALLVAIGHSLQLGHADWPAIGTAAFALVGSFSVQPSLKK